MRRRKTTKLVTYHYSKESFNFEEIKDIMKEIPLFGLIQRLTSEGAKHYCLAPIYCKDKMEEQADFIPSGSVYSIDLTYPEFLPILSNYENDLFHLKLDLNKGETLTFQLLFRSREGPEWQERFLKQYACYLEGVNYPSKYTLGQAIQFRFLQLLDRISRFHSHNESNATIEQNITSTGYLCQLQVFIQSEDSDRILQVIREQLETYSYLNEFYLSEGENSHFFHLSESSLISLFSHIKTELPVVETRAEDLVTEDGDPAIEEAIQKAVKRVGIIPSTQVLKVLSNTVGVNMQLILITIPKNTTFSSFKNKIDDLSAALGRPLSVVKGTEPNSLFFLVPLEKRKTVYLNALIQTRSFQDYAQSHAIPLCIGIDMLNEPVYEALEESPHLLVAGATKSGKSVFLNSIVTTLCKVKSVDQLQLYIVDPKQVEFNEYKNDPHVKEIVTDMNRVEELFSALIDEMEHRYKLFKQASVRDIRTYHQIMNLPYLVCIIDEYNDLLIQFPDIEKQVERLGQKARAAGIHLILATQRPDRNVMSGIIKVNFPSRISFKLSNNDEYRTVFGTGVPFRNLLGMGDGVMSYSGEQEQFIRFQAPIIAQAEPSLKEKLKRIIQNTGKTKLQELQQELGIRKVVVNDLMRELVSEGFLIKTTKGYERRQ